MAVERGIGLDWPEGTLRGRGDGKGRVASIGRCRTARRRGRRPGSERLAEDAVEGAARDAEGFGGFAALVAVELVEDPTSVATFDFGEGKYLGAGGVAAGRLRWKATGRSRTSMRPDSAIMAARPMTFSSSRMLPGHGWRARTAWARG
jgi:hypothetical protein